MQYSSKPIFGGDYVQPPRETVSVTGAGRDVGDAYRQSPATHVQREFAPAESAQTTGQSFGNASNRDERDYEQGQHGSLPRHNNRFEDRQNATANAPITHRPSWSSSAPSAGWSTSSPTAWGASQSGSSAQTWSADQGSSGQSIAQTAKEHLPGGTGSYANQSTTDSSDPTLLEKAMQYLPGSNNSHSSEQSSGGQMQGTTDTRMGSQLWGIYSRPGAEPTTFGTASDWHRPSDTNSTDCVDKLSNQAGAVNTHSSETSSNPDFMPGNNRPAGMTQHDSGSGSGSVPVASHILNFGGDSSGYGADRGHQSLSGVASRAEKYQGQSEGLTQGYGQQGQATSMAEHAEYEPVNRLPSTGIPPVFHPPSYNTSDVPSYATTGGNVSYSSDSQGVNAKQALEPLTNLQAGEVSRETSRVNAKQALDPLTHIAAHDSQEDTASIPIKNALQPLTEVSAQDNSKGFVESMREYLPGQQQTGIVQQEQYTQQPGFLDKAMAYVPSLHTSGHSHPTEELPANHVQTTQPMAMGHELHGEAQPSLLDKAKAYIPVLGSSTEFDPATEARMAEQERLYQDTPTGQARPQQVHHEGFLDRAMAYVPAIGAPGTTSAGVNAETGASSGFPHKGLVENLMEKAKEILPHQLTGAGPAPASSTTSAAYLYASGENTGMGPAIAGVRLSDRPILGPAPVTTSAAEAPGMLDRVKQLVGLGPSVDQYGAGESPTSPITASQGINAGIMGSSGRMESSAIDDVDDDAFEDALEDPVSNSFTTAAPGTGPGQSNVSQQPVSQPYVSQTGPPFVDTRNDPDETFGPVKNRDQSAQPAGSSYDTTRGSAFGDEDEYEGTPGKKGLRAKVKGRFGSKKELHQEKKRNKADQELQHKMQEKEIPKAQAVTTPAAPGQETKAATAGSNLGGGGGGMGGVAGGGNPANPQSTAQSESKDEAAKPPAAAKTDNPHLAVKANEYTSGSNVKMGAAAQQKAEEAPPKKSKGGFMSKLKKPFGK